MIRLKVKTENLAIEFAQASMLKDIDLLENLLHDKGEFEIQNTKNKLLDTN